MLKFVVVDVCVEWCMLWTEIAMHSLGIYLAYVYCVLFQKQVSWRREIRRRYNIYLNLLVRSFVNGEAPSAGGIFDCHEMWRNVKRLLCTNT